MAITAREYDFLAARKRLEAKPKPAVDKLTSLEEAAARVKDGDQIAIGGCLYSRTPLGLVRAILRRRPQGLTLSRNLMCYEAEWGLVAGACAGARARGRAACASRGSRRSRCDRRLARE